MKKKILAVVLAVVILAVAAIGATLAWLMDQTESITNTFTVGNVSIDLGETTPQTYKLIPGTTYAKDPKVTVNAGSEACYLFVKVDAAGTNVEEALLYSVRTGENEWTALPDVPGVYYREVAANEEENQSFYVLTAGAAEGQENGSVTIRSTLTSDQMDQINTAVTDDDDNTNPPTLTFTAYAIQKDNLAAPAEYEGTIYQYAWEQVSGVGA